MLFRSEGVTVPPFRPANVGFDVDWSVAFRARFAGRPLKPVSVRLKDRTVPGEVMLTRYGLEGGAIYALSAALREAIEADGQVDIHLDLKPGLTVEQLTERLARPRFKASLATHLRKTVKLDPSAVALLRETGSLPADPLSLAQRIKAAPVRLTGFQGLDRAISSAGGVGLDAVNQQLMLTARPGVFVAGDQRAIMRRGDERGHGRPGRKIVGLRRNDVSNATARIGNIAGIARDHMDVEVRHGLSTGYAFVEADVEAVRRMALCQQVLRFIDRLHQRDAFVLAEITPLRNMPLRYE